jgi:hypothetical protein
MGFDDKYIYFEIVDFFEKFIAQRINILKCFSCQVLKIWKPKGYKSQSLTRSSLSHLYTFYLANNMTLNFGREWDIMGRIFWEKWYVNIKIYQKVV